MATGGFAIEHVPYDHPDAVALREQMVAEVKTIYGEQRDAGSSGMPTGVVANTVVLTLVGYAGERPLAHALLRRLGDDLEIKRMFVAPEARGLGAANALMTALEDGARALGATRLILHTGDGRSPRSGPTPGTATRPSRSMSRTSGCLRRCASRRCSDRRSAGRSGSIRSHGCALVANSGIP